MGLESAIAAVKADLATRPDGVLEVLAEKHGVSYGTVLGCLEPSSRVLVKPQHFEGVWTDLVAWGPVTFIVHTRDGVFETMSAIPPGSLGRGYFNIHGECPLGGHLRIDRCASIYFVDRSFFGRRSCSVQFLNVDGEAMFKIFVGRDANREMRADQVARFEGLRKRFGTMPQEC